MTEIEILRTPDERFADLPDWPYEPHYVDGLPGYDGMRLHYVDEGPASAKTTFLCLHGEPSWSYLYRKMIPVFTAAGHRVVAPDFFGFGRSDKPVEDRTYGFHFHRNALIRFVERIDAEDICLVVQDWGGLLGLTLPMEFTDRISRLLIMNTTLATGEAPGAGFEQWKEFAAKNPDLPVGDLMKRATPHLTDAEAAAYDAPFPDERYKAGVRRFPQMVMVTPDMEGVDCSLRALKYLSEDWQGDCFMAIGMKDPVLGPPVMEKLGQTIRRCTDPMYVEEAGHFVQEWGEPIAKAALDRFGLA